jgi:hypothetical protein
LLDHRRWQRLAAREAGDHGLHLGAPQAGEGDLGQVRAAGPRRLKLRPTRQQGEHAGRRDLVQHQAQELYRGRVGPVQVFPHRQDGLLFRLLQQPWHQSVVRLLPLPLRGHVEKRIVRRVGQGEQHRQERGDLLQGQPRRPQRLFQCLEPGLGSISAVPVQEPLQMVDHRVEGALLVIGGTAKHQARATLAYGTLTQHLHQARFANARLPTEQHHLAPAVLAVRPALQEQQHFGLAPYQGR